MTEQADLGAHPGDGARRTGRELVWHRYLDLLTQAQSPLLTLGRAVRTQLHGQVDAVLDATVAALDLPPLPAPLRPVPANLSEEIGRRRATGGVHPAQSLWAASLVFEAALPVVTAWSEQHDGHHTAEQLSITLNSQLMQRMSAAASGYVDHLLGLVHNSNQLERRSVSRYLHDVAASNVALGLQNLELWEMYSSTDPARAAEKMDHARRSLHEALQTVRFTSEYLRADVAERGLRDAIELQLEAVPTDIRHTLLVSGPVADLSVVHAQELFLIVREAIRNAVEHAAPSTVTVEICAADGSVRGVVTDDGCGFVVPDLDSGEHSVGLDSMRERAELLAGRLRLTSELGRGTRVEVTVPLGRNVRRGRGRGRKRATR